MFPLLLPGIGAWVLLYFASIVDEFVIPALFIGKLISPMLDLVWMIFRVALTSGTAAVVLGTLLVVALSRAWHFKGHTLFFGMLYALLLISEKIIGLSLLLLLVGDQRQIWVLEGCDRPIILG